MDDIKLTEKQDTVLFAIAQWFISKETPYYRLGGVAGSGKSVLISHLNDAINTMELVDEVDDRGIGIMALSWKAANVLKSKGLPASSIHSIIYHSQKIGPNEYRQTIKSKQAMTAHYKLFVVDEASMVNEQLRDDLLYFEIPILFVGDNAQLPPITNNILDRYFMRNPDSELTTVHRVANENPIIRLATHIRNGGELPDVGIYKDKIQVIHRNQLTDEYLLGSDIVICGYNKSRIKLNNIIRSLKGIDPTQQPQINETLMCTQNSKRIGIYNGDMFNVETHINSNTNTVNEQFELHIRLKTLTHENKCVLINMPDYSNRDYAQGAVNMTFGYAITCHKAQGSEYKNVLVFTNEAMGKTKEDKTKWLYTAITRAKDKLILVV